MPKVVRFHETGGADVLKVEDLPLTEPGEGEVRLKVALQRMQLQPARNGSPLDPIRGTGNALVHTSHRSAKTRVPNSHQS